MDSKKDFYDDKNLVNTKDKGNLGEELACEFLVDRGYRIMARNYVFHKKEVDIIARDKNTIVFVEVKQRATNYFGEPYRAVDIRKQRSIIMVANNYIKQNKIDLEARFDIISIIYIPEQKPKIEHIISAFEPIIR